MTVLLLRFERYTPMEAILENSCYGGKMHYDVYHNYYVLYRGNVTSNELKVTLAIDILADIARWWPF